MYLRNVLYLEKILLNYGNCLFIPQITSLKNLPLLLISIWFCMEEGNTLCAPAFSFSNQTNNNQSPLFFILLYLSCNPTQNSLKTQNASPLFVLSLCLLLFCSLPISLNHRQWLIDPTLQASPSSSTRQPGIVHLRLIPCYCCEVQMLDWWGWGGDRDWMRRWVVRALRSCWSELPEIGEFGEQQQEEVQQP